MELPSWTTRLARQSQTASEGKNYSIIAITFLCPRRLDAWRTLTPLLTQASDLHTGFRGVEVAPSVACLCLSIGLISLSRTTCLREIQGLAISRPHQMRISHPKTVSHAQLGKPSTPSRDSTSSVNDSSRDSGNPKIFTFRSMTRSDYFELYDAIHTLVRQDELNKEEENVLYDMIGRQDKKLAAAYQRYKGNGDPMVLLEPLKERMSTRTPSRR